MEIFDLEQFVAFAKYGTLSKAAEFLHVSQPTLTKTMKRLEDEFKVPLFIRSKNKIELNEFGQFAASHAEKILSECQQTISLTQAFYKSTRTINIGTCATMPAIMLLRDLSVKQPDMSISYETRPEDILIEGLESKTYQYIILNHDIDNKKYSSYAIAEEHLMFNIPKGHRFANRECLSLSEMNGENMIVMPNTGFWEDIVIKKMPDSRFLRQTDKASFEDIIQASILPSFTTNLALIEFLQPADRLPIPVTDEETSVTFYVICLR